MGVCVWGGGVVDMETRREGGEMSQGALWRSAASLLDRLLGLKHQETLIILWSNVHKHVGVDGFMYNNMFTCLFVRTIQRRHVKGRSAP